jgi:hypothetical protein
MAEYITANRWITGVATHKTKNGRILCTGFGCIGCFPQDFPETACELEVYDSKTGLLFSESWTNELNNENAMETATDTNVGDCHFREKILPNIPNGVANNESEEFKMGKVFLTECVEETEGSECETLVERKAIKKENCAEKFLNTTQVCFEETFPVAVGKLTKHKNLHADREVVDQENSVCLFFALEHNHHSKRLSNFTILEIVHSLTTLMHVNEIKCVQRLNGLWHMALKTSKHLNYLLTNGLNIRGTCYEIVQDNDMYCEKVQ